MTTNKYISFDQLLTDLETENLRHKDLVKSRPSVAQVIGRHGSGSVTYDDFVPDKRSGPLMLPGRPDVDRIEVGSRVTLLTPAGPGQAGMYFTSVMLVLGTTSDSIEGYVFQSSLRGHAYRHVIIDHSQVIDCHSPLAPNEAEVADLVGDDIPF